MSAACSRALRWLRDDRGNGGGTAIEVLLVAPVLLIFGLLIIGGARYGLGNQQIDSAAASAARAASQQPTAAQANEAATRQAQAALTDAGVVCARTSVSVDTSGFTAAPGAAATVTATVTCIVSLSDLTVPGLPGTATLTGTAVSPLDIHREVLS